MFMYVLTFAIVLGFPLSGFAQFIDRGEYVEVSKGVRLCSNARLDTSNGMLDPENRVWRVTSIPRANRTQTVYAFVLESAYDRKSGETTLEARRTFIGRMGNNVELFIAQAREWLEVALRIKSMPELAQTHVAVDQQIAQVQQWLAVLHDKLVERKNAITSDTPLATEQLQQLNAQIQQVLALETQYTVAPTP